MIAFDPSVLSPYFQVRERRVTTPNTGNFQLCGASPDRVYLAVANATGTVLLISTLGDVSGTVGIPVATNTVFEMSYQWHGSLVCQPWYGVTATLGGKITVIEVLYTPSIARAILVPGSYLNKECDT